MEARTAGWVVAVTTAVLGSVLAMCHASDGFVTIADDRILQLEARLALDAWLASATSGGPS